MNAFVNQIYMKIPVLPLVNASCHFCSDLIRILFFICLVASNLILQGARNELFAMQPAPIQISYMGFPGTTGASYIHYLVTDEVREP